jgi:hypothetical protein
LAGRFLHDQTCSGASELQLEWWTEVLLATGRLARPRFKTIDHVVGGWAQSGTAPWELQSYGNNFHGNAMATLVQFVAPHCQLLDMRIFLV